MGMRRTRASPAPRCSARRTPAAPPESCAGRGTSSQGAVLVRCARRSAAAPALCCGLSPGQVSAQGRRALPPGSRSRARSPGPPIRRSGLRARPPSARCHVSRSPGRCPCHHARARTASRVAGEGCSPSPRSSLFRRYGRSGRRPGPDHRKSSKGPRGDPLEMRARRGTRGTTASSPPSPDEHCDLVVPGDGGKPTGHFLPALGSVFILGREAAITPPAALSARVVQDYSSPSTRYPRG